jgi:hypothetical protein
MALKTVDPAAASASAAMRAPGAALNAPDAAGGKLSDRAAPEGPDGESMKPSDSAESSNKKPRLN